MSRQRRFNVLALLSLLLLAAVLPSYGGNFALMRYNLVPGPPPRVVLAQVWQMSEGRFTLWTFAANSMPGSRSLRCFAGIRPRLNAHTFTGFDAHPFPPGASGGATYLFAFPLWPLALPSLLFPLLWLRDRRRRHGHTIQGFPLDPAPRLQSLSAAPPPAT